MRLALLAAAATLLAFAPIPATLHAETGTLVIVGGGLDPDNKEILSAFLEARPSDTPSIAIVPAASGQPSQSAQSFRQALVRHGVDPAHVEIVRLAIKDDPETTEIDESTWSDNARNELEVDRISRAGAIWFTGGDQSRITKLLYSDQGVETPMLETLRRRLTEGAVIGGTSAGAAIMSDPMITQGDTLAALLGGQVGEPLMFGRGLGFVSGIMVDQHFGERARLGRLAASLLSTEQPLRRGVGIDEDTGLVLRLGEEMGRVVGSGYVTFIDARSASLGDIERYSASNLTVSMASSGDMIDLASGEVTPAKFKVSTIGNEYFDNVPISGGGMALGATTLADVAGEALLDNSKAMTVERMSFANDEGVIFRFSQSPASRGWWGRSATGIGRYSLDGVRFDIEPVELTIRKAEQ